jgi:polyhydroxyalkanoate synthesis regulator phasin
MSDQLQLGAGAAPAPDPVVLNTDHANLMLAQRFCAPEWALMFEVAPATGGGTRYADAIAVNLWKSRGHTVHGFEVKVSRSDWLRELKDPSKCEPVLRYCDYWWIVAQKDVIKPGELPPTWGHFELRASGLVQQVQGDRLKPAEIGREFFASIMRRGHESLERAAEMKSRMAVAEARAEFDRRVEREVSQRTRHFEELRQQVARFEAETGLKFNRYEGPPKRIVHLAKRLEHLSNYGSGDGFDHLEGLAKQLEGCASTLRKALADSGMAPTKPEASHAG